MLEARQLTKRYSGLAAVNQASFTVAPGEVLGYLGPNGSGKSTTVKMITGLIDPTDGLILFNGEPIQRDMTAFKRRLGYVPEEAFLYPYLSGREYLQLIGRLRGMREERMNPKIDALLDLFQLTPSRHSLLSSYSKGMRQKVLISAALLNDPDLLVFDEPLSGLDVTSALIFRNLVRQLGLQGKMILYSSHVLEVVEKVCSKIIILRRGELVANDSVTALRDLMSLKSLEDIFAQLTQQEDTESTARQIVEVMRA